MTNPHVVTDEDGELDYVEYYIECNNTIVKLYPDPDEEDGWRVEEEVADEEGPWSKP
ncbi:MAG: hypothetical protein ACQEQY_09745 [Halobacteriota archaeon]|uniref:hypothetical protein n=1 Tax=Halanaeroarchaeum sp. HSR-CO TaxID=2866382 RepID=UPI00217EE969|nr:hypothetical protein [Halanaeroarchaeum sp. HSR-CO]UWG46425.1 hypothetical protein HSRCO_0123 [Halanaeroarchaeum sp. HSR-CO]